VTRKRAIQVLGTVAAVVVGTVAVYKGPVVVPKSQGFDPANLTAAAQNRATARLAWEQKSSPYAFAVKLNRVRVYEDSIPDGGVDRLQPWPDGGPNWDAGKSVCWCNRDGGVRDSGAPGVWDEKIPPRTAAHLIPCDAPGAECPKTWFSHGWGE